MRERRRAAAALGNMAGIARPAPRSLRRHVSLLVAIQLVALLSGVSCTPDDPEPDTTGPGGGVDSADGVDDQAAVELLASLAQESIAALSAAAQYPQLSCPPPPPFPLYRFEVRIARGGQPVVTTCPAPVLLFDQQGRMTTQAVRMQNHGGVPLTISGLASGVPYLVEPGAIVDLPLDGLPEGTTTYGYTVNVESAAFLVARDFLRTPVEELAACVDDLTPLCVGEHLAKALPRTIEVRGVRIPARRLATIFSGVVKHAALVNDWDKLRGGGASGSLVVTYTPG